MAAMPAKLQDPLYYYHKIIVKQKDRNATILFSRNGDEYLAN